MPLHHAPGKEPCEKELGDVSVDPPCLGLAATVELRPLPGVHYSCARAHARAHAHAHAHARAHAWPPTLLVWATRPDVSAWPWTCLKPVTCPAVTGLWAARDYCH